MAGESSGRPPPSRRVPESDDFPTGPGIGEVVPDFSLPDQRGRTVRLSDVLRQSRALLVFHRSARW